jgi:hypothetical protein
MQGQKQLYCKAKDRSYEDPPQPDCAEEQSNPGSQQSAHKHGDSEDDAKFQIHDTTPNNH